MNCKSLLNKSFAKKATGLMLITVLNLLGTEILAGSFIVSTNGNWTAPGTWGKTGNAQEGVTYPGPNDDVTINNDRDVTINSAVKCNTLKIQAAQQGNRESSLIIQSGSLMVNSTVEITGGGNGNKKASLFISGGALTINGNVSINSIDSNFDISTGTASLSGLVTNSAGIFNVGANCNLYLKHATSFTGNGTYTFDAASTTFFNGTSGQTIPNLNFGNVEITNSNGVDLSAAITSTNVKGFLTIRDSGKLNNKGYGISLASGKPFKMIGNAELILEGNTSLPTVVSSTISLDPNTTVTYAGNNTASIEGGSYGKLVVNSPKSLAGNVTIKGASTINASLTLNSYSLSIGDNELTVASTGSISGESSTSYIKVGAGKLTINNVGASPTLFPVGTTSSYTPASIANIGTVQSFSVGVVNGIAGVSSTDIVNKTWDVSSGGTGANITLTVYWTAGDQLSGFDPDYCVLSHFYNGAWENVGTSLGAASGSGTAANPYSKSRSGIQTFSPFGVGGPNSPLPVSWLSYNGKATANGNLLTWATASEKNSENFIVERSENGKTFEAIGTVKAAGNSSQVLNYQFTDKHPLTNATAYYRLKQTDTDGAYDYSAIIAIAKNDRFVQVLNAYPNPFGQTIHLQLAEGHTAKKVVLLTLEGKEVYSNVLTSETETVLNDLPELKAGIYFLQLTGENETTTLKVMRQ